MFCLSVSVSFSFFCFTSLLNVNSLGHVGNLTLKKANVLKGQLVLFLSGCASVPFYQVNSSILYEISLFPDPITHALIYNIHVLFNFFEPAG